VRDRRRPDRAIDFQQLYDEFKEISGGVERYLATVYLEKGGKLYTHRGKKFVRVARL